MGDELRVWVDGAPVPKGRPRTGRTRQGATVHFTPEKTKAYEEVVAVVSRAAAKRQGWPVDQHPKRLVLTFALPIPKSWTRAEREAACKREVQPTGVPDLDNLTKAVKDALNGVAWVDDSQVVDLSCSKHYALIPGVQIEIETHDATLRAVREGATTQGAAARAALPRGGHARAPCC